LEEESVTVFGLDPFYDESEIVNFGFSGVADLSQIDGIIIHTDHQEFNMLDFENFVNLKFVYDGRRSHAHLMGSKAIKYLTY
jgi:UDP-N-acetyl-D-mannosaminuronate dehydrogenase